MGCAADVDALLSLREDDQFGLVGGGIALGRGTAAGEAEARHSGGLGTFGAGVGGDPAGEVGAHFNRRGVRLRRLSVFRSSSHFSSL